MKILKHLMKLPKYLYNDDYRFIINNVLGYNKAMSDEAFLKRMFKACMGYELNLSNPKTFNEKLQWLKLYNRKPEYTMMVDKYRVREYISEKLGEEYLIPLIGVWNNPNEIEFHNLPEQFVLKCNHNSGKGMCICKNKQELNINKVKLELSKGLKEDYFVKWREWPYKNVPRKIICEKFMVDESGTELKDYKFFCFNGKPEFLFVASDRPKDTRFDFFDTHFNHLPFKQGHPWASKKIEKPANFDKMLEIASILSKDIPHVRVDLYNINGKIYFGEMTFYQFAGFVPFEPMSWDLKIGELLTLPTEIHF